MSSFTLAISSPTNLSEPGSRTHLATGTVLLDDRSREPRTVQPEWALFFILLTKSV